MEELKRFKTKELAKEVVASLYDEHPELTELYTLMPKRGEIVRLNPHEISERLVDLTSILGRVSHIASNLCAEFNDAYANRLWTEYQQYHLLRNSNIPQGDSEKFAKEMAFERKQEELVYDYVTNLIKDDVKAGWQMVSSLQSRLGALKQERTYS